MKDYRPQKINIFFIIFLLISSFLFIKINETQAATSGDLIKTQENSAVYYLGDDNKRYVFGSESVYFSWYQDFNSVITISPQELQTYPLGGNVVIRPGTKLIKITSDPSVYAVEPEGVLRKINNENQAITLFGTNWSNRVIDIPDSFFTDYKLGEVLKEEEWPLGSLIKDSVTSKYYYYDQAGFHQISSAEAFRANCFYSEYILESKKIIDTNLAEQISGKNNLLLSLIQNNTNRELAKLKPSNNNVGNNSSANSGNSSTGTSGSSNSGGGGGASPPDNCLGSDNQSCNISNGTGFQSRVCNTGSWSNWSDCIISSCNPGYQSSNQSCLVVASTSLSLRQHLINNQKFAIPSNAVNGDIVGQLNNFWARWEENNLNYSIISGEGFTIDDNGFIILSNQNLINGTDYFVLEIRALDSLHQEYENATITISVLPAAETYFIDPSQTISGDGSRENPYKSWSEINFISGKNYLQKRGTEAITSTRISLSNLQSVIIGAYGDNQNKPIIRAWNISGSSNGAIGIIGGSEVTIRDLDIDAKLSTAGIYVSAGNNNTVDHCRIQNSEWGLRTMNGPIEFKFLNSEIAYTGDDGHYGRDNESLESAFNYIHHVNQHWNENSYWYVGKTEAEAAGDGIQLNGSVFNFNIHHNIIDRSDTDNKFCIIISPTYSLENTYGLLENNYCKMRPDSNESGFYLYRGLSGVKVRYNTLANDTGIYSHSPDLLISYNIFKHSRIYVGDNGASYQIYNNIFYDPPENLGAITLWTDNMDMKNNIFYFINSSAIGLQTSSQHNVSHDYNLFYPEFRGAYGLATHDIVGDPLFKNAGGGDFRLETNSPAINMGTSIGENYDFFGGSLNVPINIGIWEN